MTAVSVTLCAVDVTNPVGEASLWWSCSECGAEVELPGSDIEGLLLSCPDCSGSLHELWCWEPVVA
jgi:DNA-directed RNA polymerase subunit RPC12/RpoP